MHDYQRKRLTEFAIHKCLILNDMFLVVWEERVGTEKLASQGRKAGASSRTPHGVFYRVNYTMGQQEVKENLVGVSFR
jgi:hypothetical protein